MAEEELKPEGPSLPSYVTSTLSRMAFLCVGAYLVTCVGAGVGTLIVGIVTKNQTIVQQAAALSTLIIGWEWRVLELVFPCYLTGRAVAGAKK